MKVGALTIIACICLSISCFAEIGKYQISVVDKNTVYMVDTETGKLWIYNASYGGWTKQSNGIK